MAEEIYPLRRGYAGVAPPEVIEAVRKAVHDWDGRNMTTVRRCIAKVSKYEQNFDNWTFEDIYQEFALSWKQMTDEFRGHPTTTNCDITPAPYSVIRIEDWRAGTANRDDNATPFPGLVFHHDSTVSRQGDDYTHIPPIELAPQCLKLLKFVFEAGERGRTKNEIVPAIVETPRILSSEKNRLKDDLIPLDLDLGRHGEYVIRCTKQEGKTSP